MSPSAAPLRWRIHASLTREEVQGAARGLRTALIGVIVVGVCAAAAKTLPGVGAQFGTGLDAVLIVTTAAFALEYLLRLWVAPEGRPGVSAGRARLAYAVSLPGLIDLIAAVPFALSARLGLDLEWLDIVPIFKLLRYTVAFQFLVEALTSERRVLASAAVLMLALLVFQSSVMYHFERVAQPDRFTSIPAAMWWGIVTLTTVGYGDITPVTPWGKVAGGVTAVLGLLMFAIPVGIIASAFVEAVRRREFVVTWNLVATVPLFRGLDAARIAAIAGLLRARQAAPGERLVRRGDRADAMYFVVSGEVDVDLEAGGPRFTLGAGDFFGEIALIADRTRTATITAATPCKLLVLDKRDFNAFMAAHPELAELVQATAARRLQAAVAPGDEPA